MKTWRGKLPLGCFYCGVDARELKTILIVMIGGFVLGSLFVLVWSLLTGAFHDVERVKHEIIDRERNRK